MAMKEGLIGRKKGMTQVFGEDGNLIPVTVVEAGPCTVVGLRTRPTHGYDAIQLGFEPRKKNVNKAMAGLYKKAGVASAMRVLREIRLQKTEAVSAYQVGQTLTVDLFTPGEFVDVVGTTKGKGFQGGVRRYGWAGGDETHGSMFHRRGRMGADRRTVLNVVVARVIPEQNLVLLRGAVPGAIGGLVVIRKSVKQTKAQQQKAKETK